MSWRERERERERDEEILDIKELGRWDDLVVLRELIGLKNSLSNK